MLKTFSGNKASQNQYELQGFVELLQKHDVRRYLEIGARHGDTFHYIMSSLPAGSTGVAVDLPGALWGTSASTKYLNRAIHDLNRKGYVCSSLFGNSQTLATKHLILGRGPYDAILIDGDHTLVAVSKDWELYGDMAPLVAFHDIVGTGQAEKRHGNPVEVPMLWAEIKARRHHAEFIADGSKMGIGVCISI
jgi:hypothetical protein